VGILDVLTYDPAQNPQAMALHYQVRAGRWEAWDGLASGLGAMFMLHLSSEQRIALRKGHECFNYVVALFCMWSTIMAIAVS
jgi:hypothetical protein